MKLGSFFFFAASMSEKKAFFLPERRLLLFLLLFRLPLRLALFRLVRRIDFLLARRFGPRRFVLLRVAIVPYIFV
jgi:hypothetical protein